MMNEVKLLIIAIIISATLAAGEWDIDWSEVRFRQDPETGFWENRLVLPSMLPSFKYNQDNNGRIVGGWEVSRHKHPYQAGLLMQAGASTFLCGGSIIREDVVMTAAHCPEQTTRTIVVGGAHQLSANEATQQRITVEMRGYRFHQQYNPRTFNNDICLLILTENKFVFNDYIKPIALPRSEELRARDFVGEWATLSGWGRTNNSHWLTSSVLRATSNYVITNDECSTFYGSQLVVNSTLCMLNDGAASCHGDSGGPLTIYGDDQNKEQIQIGIVSFGSASTCLGPRPDGYTRVTHFIEWIDMTINRGRIFVQQ